MKKIQIIILILVIVVMFFSTFGVTFGLKRAAQAKQLLAPGKTVTDNLPESVIDDKQEIELLARKDTNITMSMTEKQLQTLIYDIREKMKKYEQREKELSQKEERLQIANETLHEDIEKLNNLRAKLGTTFASLQKQEENLDKKILEIDEIQKDNFKKISDRYNMMDTEYSTKIAEGMYNNGQLNDLAMIIFYMEDRKAAQLIGEIGNSNQELSSLLMDKLKMIKETDQQQQ